MSGEQNQPLPAAAAKPQRRQLFISYSHKDSAWVERLRTMLRPLEQRHGLERWDDGRIQAGDLWREEIEKALASAQVALLMVSDDFLASDFVTRSELPPLFTAAEQDGLRILWVPLSPCLWKYVPEIERYKAVIPPARTVAEMDPVEQKRAFVQIAEQILSTFQEEAERQARESQEEQERLTRQQEALERKAEQERLEREREASRSQEAERERLARERQEEEQRQVREEEERRALAEAERWKAEAERLAREKEALERRVEQARAATDGPERSKADGLPDSHRKQAAAPISLRLQVLAGSLVSDGTGFFGGRKWRVETRAVEVEGYREELGDGVALTMLRIPAGGFVMGSPSGEKERSSDEGPQHSVRLQEFFLGQTPITQAQWKLVAGWEKVGLDLNSDPARFKGSNRPVEQVNWHDAMEFCRRLSARTGRTYTLPSEAQWEYACRSGTTTPYAFGETITTDLANYDGNVTYADGPKGDYRQKTTPVGSFPANAWGLHDMHGNVWEWCLDHKHNSYEGAPTDGSAWLAWEAGEDSNRLLRGGSWSSNPRCCRSAFRFGDPPGDRYGSSGFRVCCLPQDLLLDPLAPQALGPLDF